MSYQPKTGALCSCRPGVERDNCPTCEGTGEVIDFGAIRARTIDPDAGKTTAQLLREHQESREQSAAELFAIIDAGTGPDPDHYGGGEPEQWDDDQAYTRLSELPLAVTVQRVLRVDISTGGPAEWIEAKLGADGAVDSATFHYADWGTHDSYGIEERSALWRLTEYYAESVAELGGAPGGWAP